MGAEMKGKRMLLFACAGLAALGAVFFFLGIFAQAMLGGVSEREVWFDRIVVWLVYFPIAGALAMTSVYLIRRARRGELPVEGNSAGLRRVVLFPLGWLCLAASLYFADFASYLGRHPSGSSIASFPDVRVYQTVAAVLLIASLLSFVWARKKLA